MSISASLLLKILGKKHYVSDIVSTVGTLQLYSDVAPGKVLYIIIMIQ